MSLSGWVEGGWTGLCRNQLAEVVEAGGVAAGAAGAAGAVCVVAGEAVAGVPDDESEADGEEPVSAWPFMVPYSVAYQPRPFRWNDVCETMRWASAPHFGQIMVSGES